MLTWQLEDGIEDVGRSRMELSTLGELEFSVARQSSSRVLPNASSQRPWTAQGHGWSSTVCAVSATEDPQAPSQGLRRGPNSDASMRTSFFVPEKARSELHVDMEGEADPSAGSGQPADAEGVLPEEPSLDANSAEQDPPGQTAPLDEGRLPGESPAPGRRRSLPRWMQRAWASAGEDPSR